MVKKMHIWNNIRNFLYDQNNFIALYNNQLFIYHYSKIVGINSKEISLYIEDKLIKIVGTELKVIKSSKDEIVFRGIIERIALND